MTKTEIDDLPALDLEDVTTKSVVYIVRDRGKTVQYVGVTKSLVHRLAGHCKTTGALSHLKNHTVSWVVCESKEEAETLERKLIRQLMPPLNGGGCLPIPQRVLIKAMREMEPLRGLDERTQRVMAAYKKL